MKNMINNDGKGSVAGIWGYLYEVDTDPKSFRALKIRKTGENSKHPGTEYIGGEIKVATDEACTNIITINYSYVAPFFPPKPGSNEPRENGTYKILKRIIDGDLKTVMNSSKEEAAKVKCSPKVGINEFYMDNREGGDEPAFISTKINDGGFISLIKELPEDESSRAMFDVDFFAKGTRMIEADEENDRPAKMIVSGAVFNYSGALLPVEFSVLDPAAINYFENCDISNSNPLFTRIKGKQISSVVKTKREEQGAFGDPIVKEFTSTRKDWIIIWAAAEPYEFPSEDFGVEDIQKAMQDRELHLAELKQRYLDRKEAKKNGANAFQSTPTASPAPGGFNF